MTPGQAQITDSRWRNDAQIWRFGDRAPMVPETSSKRQPLSHLLRNLPHGNRKFNFKGTAFLEEEASQESKIEARYLPVCTLRCLPRYLPDQPIVTASSKSSLCTCFSQSGKHPLPSSPAPSCACVGPAQKPATHICPPCKVACWPSA